MVEHCSFSFFCFAHLDVARLLIDKGADVVVSPNDSNPPVTSPLA
jgi:hypothetical protein